MPLPSFKRVMRGYDPESVDNSWIEIEKQISETTAANKELKLQLISLKEQNSELQNRLKNYETMDKDLRDALLNAQKIANQVQDEAKLKADNLISNARNEAEAIIQEATEEAENTKSESVKVIEELQEQINATSIEYENLLTLRDEMKQRLEQAQAFLKSAEDLIHIE